MHVVVLGGTIFVGRHIVTALSRAGHRVTLFNRGQTNHEAFPDLECVRGDRTKDLANLGERRFDAVVDTSGYLPHEVETAARYFADKAGRYVFISTISVFDPSGDELNEESPLLTLPEGASLTARSDEAYGALKVLCERIVNGVFGDRATILRPAVIGGPFDPTDRFTYYSKRFAEGGRVLLPDPSYKLLMIDARDLGRFVVHVLEREIGGDYNIVAPDHTFGRLSRGCDGAFATDGFLLERGVKPWQDLPLWVPRGTGYDGIHNASARRALDAGLGITSLSKTLADTLAWASTLPSSHRWAAGLTRKRESEILERLA